MLHTAKGGSGVLDEHAMDMFWKITPWFSRVVLFLAGIIFTLIAVKFIGDPVGAATPSGILLTTPLAHTDMRVGFGAFPLGFAAIAFWCASSTRRLTMGLGLILTVIGLSLAVRIFGVMTDHTLTQSMPLLFAEGALFTLSMVAIIIESQRRRRGESGERCVLC
jgi:hypothetical protein